MDRFLERDISKVDLEHTRNSLPSNVYLSKGTTTLAMIYNGGIVVAVDSRATMGSYISNKFVAKAIEIDDRILGTMAGCAADCQYWTRDVACYAKKYFLENNEHVPIKEVSYYLSNRLFALRGRGLSIGTFIAGYDGDEPNIYQVSSEGEYIKVEKYLSVGSGSLIASSILAANHHNDMTKEEAIKVGKDSIMAAGHRDSYSGGTITVYHIDANGREKIGSFDIDAYRRETE